MFQVSQQVNARARSPKLRVLERHIEGLSGCKLVMLMEKEPPINECKLRTNGHPAVHYVKQTPPE